MMPPMYSYKLLQDHALAFTDCLAWLQSDILEHREEQIKQAEARTNALQQQLERQQAEITKCNEDIAKLKVRVHQAVYRPQHRLQTYLASCSCVGSRYVTVAERYYAPTHCGNCCCRMQTLLRHPDLQMQLPCLLTKTH